MGICPIGYVPICHIHTSRANCERLSKMQPTAEIIEQIRIALKDLDSSLGQEIAQAIRFEIEPFNEIDISEWEGLSSTDIAAAIIQRALFDVAAVMTEYADSLG